LRFRATSALFRTTSRSREADRLRQTLEAAAELSIFCAFDHGALLRLYGQKQNAMQYLIGNPLTASTMTRYEIAAGLYTALEHTLSVAAG